MVRECDLESVPLRVHYCDVGVVCLNVYGRVRSLEIPVLEAEDCNLWRWRPKSKLDDKANRQDQSRRSRRDERGVLRGEQSIQKRFTEV